MSSNCAKCQAENAKFRCGNCKNISYCSSECQRADWKEHKPLCSKPAQSNQDKENVKTVIVNGIEAQANSISTSELQNKEWEKCELPAILGIPLMVRVLSYPPKRPINELAIFLMVDPVTGIAAPKWQQRVGRVEFARSDKLDFDVQTFWDLHSYIFYLMDYYGEDIDYERFSKYHLIPKAFKNFCDYEHHMQNKYKESQKQYSSNPEKHQ